MGVLLTVACASCGYSSDLSVGIGMRQILVEVYRCRNCGELSSLPVEGPKQCPDCLGHDLEAWPVSEDSAIAPCPRCGAEAAVEDRGNWD